MQSRLVLIEHIKNTINPRVAAKNKELGRRPLIKEDKKKRKCCLITFDLGCLVD